MTKHLPSLHRRLGATVLSLSMAAACQAQDNRPDCTLRIASGPAGKVYEQMVRDMQAVCGATVSVCSVPSSGGLQNLSLLSGNEAQLGLVQIDTLDDMRRGDENIQTLQAVMPLHNNLLHVVTLASGSRVGVSFVPRTNIEVPGTGSQVVIRKFSELKGRTVAVVGSAQLLGQTLEKQTGYGMRLLIAEDDDAAIKQLRAGTVQAIFTLGGWPLPSIARHRVNSGLILADYDLKPQSPYVAVKRNYQNLDAFNLTLLGVPNLLVTRPFKSGGVQHGRVAALQRCLREQIDELQEGQYRPAWKEVKDIGVTYGVAPFIAGTVMLPVRAKSVKPER